MSCATCASRIEATLRKLDGVREATVSFPTEKAIVTVDENFANKAMVVATIRDIGFNVVEQVSSWEDIDAATKSEITRQSRLCFVGLVLTVPLFILSMGATLASGEHGLMHLG